MPLGARIAFVGDSNSQLGYTYQNWTLGLMALSSGKVFAPPGANRAVAGTATDYGVSDIANVVALGPAVVAVMYGTNDGWAASQTEANLRTMYNAYKAAGAKVLALGILPSNYGNFDARALAINAWIAAQPDVYYVRTDNLTGASSSGGESVHINFAQQMSLASNVASVLAGLTSTASIYDGSPASIADTSFAGTGGTLGTNATGTIPTGWTLGRVSGTGSATISKTTQGGNPAVQFTVTGPAWYRLNRFDAVSWTTSNYFDGWAEVSLSGDSPDIAALITGGHNLFEDLPATLDISRLGGPQVWRPISVVPASAGSSLETRFDLSVAAGKATTVTLSRIVVQMR